MALTLVVLAAGMGSRYGGLKQIDPVGPGGETVLDYAVFDAIRAGFDRVLFVIRRDFEARFRETIGARYAGRVTVDYAFQAPEALPPGFRPPAGREKPWGTGHALWCARAAVPENFAVINADDFYGEDSFRQLANFLRGARGPEAAIVGFRLANTLSEHGAVSRGVCSAAAPGDHASIVEQTGILPTEVGAGKKYSGQEIVSPPRSGRVWRRSSSLSLPDSPRPASIR
jgi:NDP-sugar pyrophosphorylase family protein